MNSPYLTRTVFVQSGASRSIVIESPRSFRLLYLPSSSSSASRVLGRPQKFILQSFRAAALFTNIYSFWSRNTVPHDFILSPRQHAFFHARWSWKIGTPLDVATVIPERVFGIHGRSGKENARGGCRDYRAVIRHNTASVSSRACRWKRMSREEKYTEQERKRANWTRAKLWASMAEVIVQFLDCYFVYHGSQHHRAFDDVNARRWNRADAFLRDPLMILLLINEICK